MTVAKQAKLYAALVEELTATLDAIERRIGTQCLQAVEDQYLTVLGLYWLSNTGREAGEVWKLARRTATTPGRRLGSYPLASLAVTREPNDREAAFDRLVEHLRWLREIVECCSSNGLELPTEMPAETLPTGIKPDGRPSGL